MNSSQFGQPDSISFRLHTLDSMRFIASFAIVLYHYVPYIDGKNGDFGWSFRNFYVFVDLFFIISGVVISYNYAGKINSVANFGEFIKRRLARLYPLHLVTLLFYAAIGIAVSYGYGHVVMTRKYNFDELLPNLFLTHAWGFSSQTAFNSPSWSVSAEMFAYLSFPILYRLISHSIVSTVLTITILFLMCVTLSELYFGRHLTQLSVPFSILRALPSFAVGVALFCHREHLPKMSTPTLLSLLMLTGVGSIAAMIFGFNDYLILLILILFVSAAFIADRDRVKSPFSAQLLSSMSYLTYSMYMLHGVIATVFLAYVFPKLLGNSLEMKIVAVFASILITLIVSMVSFKYFENPVRLLINCLRLSPQTARAGLQ
jgi:peptidoglycan/LPS O-acetylase OafA/YrhL